jgi:hypothetical protein
MQTASQLVFAVVVAILALFVPQVATVLLLAMIYLKLDTLGRA